MNITLLSKKILTFFLMSYTFYSACLAEFNLLEHINNKNIDVNKLLKSYKQNSKKIKNYKSTINGSLVLLMPLFLLSIYYAPVLLEMLKSYLVSILKNADNDFYIKKIEELQNKVNAFENSAQQNSLKFEKKVENNLLRMENALSNKVHNLRNQFNNYKEINYNKSNNEGSQTNSISWRSLYNTFSLLNSSIQFSVCFAMGFGVLAILKNASGIIKAGLSYFRVEFKDPVLEEVKKNRQNADSNFAQINNTINEIKQDVTTTQTNLNNTNVKADDAKTHSDLALEKIEEIQNSLSPVNQDGVVFQIKQGQIEHAAQLDLIADEVKDTKNILQKNNEVQNKNTEAQSKNTNDIQQLNEGVSSLNKKIDDLNSAETLQQINKLKDKVDDYEKTEELREDKYLKCRNLINQTVEASNELAKNKEEIIKITAHTCFCIFFSVFNQRNKLQQNNNQYIQTVLFNKKPTKYDKCFYIDEGSYASYESNTSNINSDSSNIFVNKHQNNIDINPVISSKQHVSVSDNISQYIRIENQTKNNNDLLKKNINNSETNNADEYLNNDNTASTQTEEIKLDILDKENSNKNTLNDMIEKNINNDATVAAVLSETSDTNIKKTNIINTDENEYVNYDNFINSLNTLDPKNKTTMPNAIKKQKNKKDMNKNNGKILSQNNNTNNNTLPKMKILGDNSNKNILSAWLTGKN